jgi:hypothetical protein
VRLKTRVKLLLSACLCVGALPSCSVNNGPESIAEMTTPDLTGAKILFAKTVDLAKASKIECICQEVAASEGNCKNLVQSANDMRLSPGRTVPVVTGHEFVTPKGSTSTLILHLTGMHDDGRHYMSDFAVIRIRTGELRSLTPIYWSEVKFTSQ